MAAATATESKKRTPTRTESAAPPQPVEAPHWIAERVLGERFGADLLLTLSRTDRVDHQAERDALILQIVREVVEQLPTLESRDRVEQIRAELSSLSDEINETGSDYAKAQYKLQRFDPTTSNSPGSLLANLEADVRGLQMKEGSLRAKSNRLILALRQAEAAIGSEIADRVREAITKRSNEFRRRRDAAVRELLRCGQELFDAVSQSDSGWRELQSDSIAQIVLRKVGESR